MSFATQFFSENIGVFAGKTVRIEGDPNRFAAGRGREQFSNLAFVANPIPLLAIPYSSMSAGVFYTSDPLFNQYLRFFQWIKGFSVEQPISACAAQLFALTVLPWAACFTDQGPHLELVRSFSHERCIKFRYAF